MDLHQCITVAEHAVREAGKIILQYRRHDQPVTYKPDKSPLTTADHHAEQTIRSIIHHHFALHGFIGEEFPPLRGRSNYTWIGDAIDGTWSYLNGETTVSTSLALCVKRHATWNVLLSIIFNPFTNELYAWHEGSSFPTKNGKPLTSAEKKSDACVVNFQIARAQQDVIAKLYHLWQEKKIHKLISTGGSISYNLAKIAEGAHSNYLLIPKHPLEVWDYLAGMSLVQSAGGEVTDHKGNSLIGKKKISTLLASKNTASHHSLLASLEA